ncbi:hypothetical protein BE08_29885 [Sorangium cellulosum]|uniref:Zinc-finger domain-containing protein n=1 Tax=Sorangium cellulosum TaxID=56 RepID=A0A150P376_SORCE|nr:hypothetical protein BE08_29885 [Sorangium cellulosum]
MIPSPYPAPPACTDPQLGAQATQALGLPPPGAVATHLAVCPACRLQHAAFAGLDAHAVPPSPALRAHLRRLALRGLPAP